MPVVSIVTYHKSASTGAELVWTFAVNSKRVLSSLFFFFLVVSGFDIASYLPFNYRTELGHHQDALYWYRNGRIPACTEFYFSVYV